jgi:molecular chaperone DnaJ
MITDRDYYKILGLPKGASLSDIKKRFRQLALRYHPDRNPEDPSSEESFKLVAEAYHVLSDQKRRRLYDRKGHQGLQEHGYRGFHRTEDVLRTFASEFFDFLGISGMQPQRGPLPGADLCYQLELSPEEAAMGVKRTIQISTMKTCPHCLGNGFKPTSTIQACPWCRGSGRYRESSGIFTTAGVCPKCDGSGNLRQLSCSYCEGHGRREVKKDFLVNIPAGVENNTRLIISQEGDGGAHQAESGDLYLLLQVRLRSKKP